MTAGSSASGAAVHRGLRGGLLVFIGLAWLLNAWYAVKQPIWSPRDEIAHFDYIDRLSHGALPNPRSDISPHTLALSAEHFTWIRPAPFDGTAASMGIAGKSYEAEQPPLYYALLAIPHRLLENRIGSAAEVRTLRLLSLSFVFLATGLVLLAARWMAAIGASFDVTGYVAALALSITNVASNATLGNDALSATCGALALYLFVRALAAPDRGVFPLWLAAVVSVSVLLVKPTNVVLVLAPVALAVRSAGSRSSRFALALLLPIPLWWGYRLVESSHGLGSVAAQEYFASWVKGDPSTFSFLNTLLRRAMNLEHIGVWPPPAAGIALGATLVLSLVYFTLTLRSWSPPASRLAAVALGMTGLTLVGAALLNRWSPGVHWHAFRHYSAVLPFLVIAVLAPLHQLPRNATSAAGGVSLAVAMAVVAAQVRLLLL